MQFQNPGQGQGMEMNSVGSNSVAASPWGSAPQSREQSAMGMGASNMPGSSSQMGMGMQQPGFQSQGFNGVGGATSSAGLQNRGAMQAGGQNRQQRTSGGIGDAVGWAADAVLGQGAQANQQQFSGAASYSMGQAGADRRNSATDKARQFVAQHQSEVKGYVIFAILVLVVFWFFSDGDFSFLLTLASIISMSSFLMVVISIEGASSSRGISVKMMECYLTLLLARLFAIIPFEGYLPYDRSGDWLYQVVECLSFVFAGTIVWLCRNKYIASYDPGMDTLPHLYLIVPALVLALIFHPSLNAFTPSDICWAFALYLESVASLPQLFMFQKTGQVEPWTAHFLAAQAMAKLISFIFWLSSFGELSDPNHSVKTYVGHWVLLMQGFQLLVMGDFIYQYSKCLANNKPINFMLSEDV